MELAFLGVATGFFGYVILFAVLIASSVSIPIPEDIVLLVAGYLASTASLSLWFVIPVAVFGVVVGDNIGFWLGRHGGWWLGRVASSEVMKNIEGYYVNHGAKTVFVSRFMTGIRNLFHVAAGASGMRWSRFFVFDLLGAVIAVPLVILIGYFFGSQIGRIALVIWSVDRTIGYVVLILFVGLALCACIWRERMKHLIVHKWVNSELKQMILKSWYYRVRHGEGEVR